MTAIAIESKADLLAAETAPDLTARLAAINAEYRIRQAAHDARLEEFRESVMAGLADLRALVAVPAWRHMLGYLRRGGDAA